MSNPFMYDHLQQREPGKATASSAHGGDRDAPTVGKSTLVQSEGSGGQPLPTTLIRKFESSLGTDLSGVRVHTDAAAASSAAEHGARAYAEGQDIYFGDGQYDPSSTQGEQLLAHEVAHTVQQRGGSPIRQLKLKDVSAPTDAHEHEADRAAAAMVSGSSFATSATHVHVARSAGGPDLAAISQLNKTIATTYLHGPSNTTLQVQLNARLFGNTHTHGSAAIGGKVVNNHGKLEGLVNYKFRNHSFAIGLTADGHLKAEVGASGDFKDLHWNTKIVSNGPRLSIHLDGFIDIPGPHGSSTQLGCGIYIEMLALKNPPRNVQVDPQPVTIPLKVLIPTIAAVSSLGVIGIAGRILEGIAAEVLIG